MGQQGATRNQGYRLKSRRTKRNPALCEELRTRRNPTHERRVQDRSRTPAEIMGYVFVSTVEQSTGAMSLSPCGMWWMISDDPMHIGTACLYSINQERC